MYPYRKLRFLAFFLFICLHAPAQEFSFAAFKNDPSYGQNVQSTIKKRYEEDVSFLSGNNKKYIADIYEERYQLIKERFTSNEILTATEPQQYLSALADEILKNNPEYNSKGLNILFSKSFYANATSMGEGSIFFNIGLFHRLQNESQAAFVLCHELAHYYLNHNNNNIHQYVTTIYSDNFQQKLQSIQKLSYEKNKQLDALAKNLLFRNRRHGRAFEHAADSMALELMKNTNYDIREALTCLSILDSADKDKYSQEVVLEQHFNFASFPFKKSWIENDDLVFVKTEDKESHDLDSLKTHPDCAKRIEVLKEKVRQYEKKGSKKFIVSESKFNALIKQFDYEVIEYCVQSGRISRALYYALEMIQIYPGDPYLNTIIGKCLNELYTTQKNHTLSKIVDLPNPEHDIEYNSLLHMIQNLRLREIAALSFYFLKEREPQFYSFAPFAEVYNYSKQHFNQ